MVDIDDHELRFQQLPAFVRPPHPGETRLVDHVIFDVPVTIQAEDGRTLALPPGRYVFDWRLAETGHLLSSVIRIG